MIGREFRILAPLACFASVTCLVAPVRGEPVANPTAGAESTVRELYRLVSFEPGAAVDWDAVRGLFLPQAVVVLRTSWEATSVFTLDGFVQDFVDFIAKPGVRESPQGRAVVDRRSGAGPPTRAAPGFPPVESGRSTPPRSC